MEILLLPTFYMVSQNSWMVVVFPIQIFWTVVVFTIHIFLTILIWQVFCLFYNTNFEFLSGMLLPWNINGSSSFYKGPQTCKVSKSAEPAGPLQKLLLPFIFHGSVPLLLIKHELKLPSEVRPGLLFIQIQFQAVWFQYSFEKLNNGAQFLSVKLKKKTSSFTLRT